MTTIIDLNDLRHSINRALTLGRYQIVVKTAGAEQVPASITLDLLERDDDEYSFPTDDPAPVKRTVEELVLKLSVDSSDFDAQISAMTQKATETAVSIATDDHGAAIPEQAESLVKGQFSEPRVYEFALQDAVFIGPNAKLQDVVTGNCPDLKAYAAADWVHVYDRVTRERRTLKRPEPDAVLTGLRDVAADLRGGPVSATYANTEKGAEAFVPADDAMHRAAVEAGYADLGAYVETRTERRRPATNFHTADPLPPVGPLTSTEGLKAGDIIRALTAPASSGWEEGDLLKVEDGAGKFVEFFDQDGDHRSRPYKDFAFVARPGVWMPWEGGENPVPGMRVRTRFGDGSIGDAPSKEWSWSCDCAQITAYMVVDTPPASSDT